MTHKPIAIWPLLLRFMLTFVQNVYAKQPYPTPRFIPARTPQVLAVALLGRVYLGKRLSWREFAALVVVVLGVAVVVLRAVLFVQPGFDPHQGVADQAIVRCEATVDAAPLCRQLPKRYSPAIPFVLTCSCRLSEELWHFSSGGGRGG